MADDEKWYLLLDQYPPPGGKRGDPEEADEIPQDDAPWRKALRAAAEQARRQPPGPTTPRSPREGKRRAQPLGVPPPGPSAGPVAGNAPRPPLPPMPTIHIGDRVEVCSLGGVPGTVKAVGAETALVETAAARVRVSLAELILLAGGGDAALRRPASLTLARTFEDPEARTVGVGGKTGRRRQRWHGLDLHGMLPSEALDLLDEFLYCSWEEGREAVAIIHGKGTGSLRKAVRGMLVAHPAVRHQHAALPNSGGDGVTIVALHARPDLFDERDP